MISDLVITLMQLGEQMEILMNRSDLDFLLKHFDSKLFSVKFQESIKKGEFLAKGKYPTGKYSLELQKTEIEEILDSLSSLLMEIGLNQSSEPNAVGQRIERLIDIINVDH